MVVDTLKKAPTQIDTSVRKVRKAELYLFKQLVITDDFCFKYVIYNKKYCNLENEPEMLCKK